jgi:hypothetical protein
LFIGAVRHGHDVDVLELRSGFAPVAMRQNVVTANFSACFNFTTVRHRPMKERVESGDPHTASRRLDVFQEGRKAPDNFSRSQFFRHAIEFFRGDAGFIGTCNPRRRFDLFRSKFALECEKHTPFGVT